MKIFQPLLFLLASEITVYAQLPYVPFPEANAVWHVGYKYFSYAGTYQDQYTYSDDTTINGLNYVKLSKTSECKCPIYSFTDQGTIGFIRQDTLLRTVYYYPKDDSMEYLLFDFNLQIGEIYPPTYTYDQNDLVLVKIDSMLTGSFYRRVFLFSNGSEDTARLIEGIGSDAGLLTAVDYYCFEQCRWLSCFQQSGETVYSQTVWGQYPICEMTVVEEFAQESDRVNLLPNPTLQNGEVTLQLGEAQNFKVLIHDLTGKLFLLAYFHHVSEAKLSTYSLPKGVYVVRIFTEGLPLRKKLIIQ